MIARSGVLTVALALALAACGGSRGAPPPAPSRPGVKLVVLVVVDQLPMWTFERDRPHFKGGFARLAREGAFAVSEMPYATPFTAVGHATIGTGAPPSVHGIIGNTWYRRGDNVQRGAEYDPDAPALVVGPSHGGELGPGDVASGRALRVDGIAEALRAATGGVGKSIAIGLKGRAVAFVAGKQPDLAVWYEAAAGGMTTSKRYAREAPAWLVQLARDRPSNRFFDRTWEPLDAGLLARVTGIPDDNPAEGAGGMTAAFPHRIAGDPAPAEAVLHSPFGDLLVLDATYAALDAMQLGADDVPDLLAISFAAHDYVGHVWGPDSWEVLDLMMRLDAALGSLFDALDTRLGKDGWAAVLTSDHGATPLVERTRVPGARRIASEEIARAAHEAMAAVLGEVETPGARGRWVSSVTSSTVYLAPQLADVRDPDSRGAALDAAVAAIAKLPGIAAAGRNDKLGDCAARAGLERAACLSYADGVSGELYVVPAAGSLISDYRGGTHHDAPFDDNRLVPVFVRAPGLAPTTSATRVSSLQVAPTVTALLRVPAPPAATAPPLFGLR
ncbi:MAG: alkaline phosphatase family protein [Deltaproteobacteria bacterium]|nr:alkaline phosphatase family protein [Deltaproteobacteria bacterium]